MCRIMLRFILDINFEENLKKTNARVRPARDKLVDFSSKISALNSLEIARKHIKLYKYTCLLCAKPSNVFQAVYLRFKLE